MTTYTVWTVWYQQAIWLVNHAGERWAGPFNGYRQAYDYARQMGWRIGP